MKLFNASAISFAKQCQDQFLTSHRRALHSSVVTRNSRANFLVFNLRGSGRSTPLLHWHCIVTVFLTFDCYTFSRYIKVPAQLEWSWNETETRHCVLFEPSHIWAWNTETKLENSRETFRLSFHFRFIFTVRALLLQRTEIFRGDEPPICSDPESRSTKRNSASVRRRSFLNQRTVGAGSPLTAHCSTAMLLIGSVWFWGPWWMIGGGRTSLSACHTHTHNNNNTNYNKYTSLTNKYFLANRSGIRRCVQCKCPLLSHHFGRTLDWYLRRLRRDVIFIPKTLGH